MFSDLIPFSRSKPAPPRSRPQLNRSTKRFSGFAPIWVGTRPIWADFYGFPHGGRPLATYPVSLPSTLIPATPS